MGMLDKVRRRTREEPGAPPRSVVAAAMPMSGPGVARIQAGRQQASQEQWQREGWYYFDVIGELRGPLRYIANAVSQASVHAAELDPDTDTVAGPSDDVRAQRAAAMVLGGDSKRAGLLRTLALCWQVPGEAWIIIRPTPNRGGRVQPDQWLVLSGNKVRVAGRQWTYTDPFNGATVTLGGADRLIRLWDPHPDDQAKADSAVRPALPILREVEKSSQNIAARLDSRLSGNGVALMADELDFPRGEHDTQAAALLDLFLSTAEASLQNPGQASAQVPLVLTAPGELIANGGAMAHLDMATQFDGSVVELRQAALSRLAATLDMPKEVAEGTQGESNHWSAWQVEESTYKIFIEPLLKAIGDAITEHWFRPALVAMGMDRDAAERFALAWDTTAIVARPDDTENLRDLHDRALISDSYMLTENGIPEDAAPDEDEKRRRLMERIVIGAPTLLADPNIARELLGIEIAPAAAGVANNAIENDPNIDPSPETTNTSGTRELPATQSEEPVPEGLTAAAELLVYDALSRAGGRLLTRPYRGQFASTPKHELHTVIPVTDVPGLMEGSFQFADGVAETFGMRPAQLKAGLAMYVEHLLKTGKRYSRDDMHWWMR